MRHGTSNAVIRRFKSCLALQIIDAVLAQCKERIGPNDEDEVPRTAPKISRVKLNGLSVGVRSRRVVGSNPTTRSKFVM